MINMWLARYAVIRVEIDAHLENAGIWNPQGYRLGVSDLVKALVGESLYGKTYNYHKAIRVLKNRADVDD